MKWLFQLFALQIACYFSFFEIFTTMFACLSKRFATPTPSLLIAPICCPRQIAFKKIVAKIYIFCIFVAEIYKCCIFSQKLTNMAFLSQKVTNACSAKAFRLFFTLTKRLPTSATLIFITYILIKVRFLHSYVGYG